MRNVKNFYGLYNKPFSFNRIAYAILSGLREGQRVDS